MKRKITFLMCATLYVITLILTFIAYNSLSNNEFFSKVGTQENYSWSVLKLYASSLEMKKTIEDKNYDKIILKNDLLHSRLYVLDNDAESTKFLRTNDEFRELVKEYRTYLGEIDKEIDKNGIVNSRLEPLVEKLITISRKMINATDHALSMQKAVTLYEYITARNDVRNVVVASQLLLILMLIITLKNVSKVEKNLKDSHTDILNKNAFLGKLGHEMRSSLQVIIGTIDLLMQDKSISKNDNILRLLRSSEKIERQMRDLSDYAKIDSKETPVNNSTFNLYDLAKDIIQDNNIRFSSTEEVLVVGDDNLFITSDREKIAQIIDNLVSNSLKYAKGCTKKLTFTLFKEKILSLNMYDEGVGIKPDKLKLIFTPFYRTSSNDVPGVGMGLAIVKGLTNVLNGQISVDSNIGKGTHFSIKLPVTKPVELPEPTGKNEDTVTLKSLNILVIDDDVESLSTIADMLESLGQNVTRESDPYIALRKLRRIPYDLVITDLQMPSLSGLEIIDRIKSIKGPNFQTPFRIISAYQKIEGVQNYDHLCKPVRKADLRDMLKGV